MYTVWPIPVQFKPISLLVIKALRFCETNVSPAPSCIISMSALIYTVSRGLLFCECWTDGKLEPSLLLYNHSLDVWYKYDVLIMLLSHVCIIQILDDFLKSTLFFEFIPFHVNVPCGKDLCRDWRQKQKENQLIVKFQFIFVTVLSSS